MIIIATFYFHILSRRRTTSLQGEKCIMQRQAWIHLYKQPCHLRLLCCSRQCEAPTLLRTGDTILHWAPLRKCSCHFNINKEVNSNVSSHWTCCQLRWRKLWDYSFTIVCLCIVIIMSFCFLAGCSVHPISCVERPDLCGQIRLESCLKIRSPLREIGWDGSDLLPGAIPGCSIVQKGACWKFRVSKFQCVNI